MKYKYSINIWWSEDDNSYVSEVPELPGCMSDGKTYNEVIKNTERIIEEWIEMAKSSGKKIPQPKFKKKVA